MKWLAGIAIEKIIGLIIDLVSDLFIKYRRKKKIKENVNEIMQRPSAIDRADRINDILS